MAEGRQTPLMPRRRREIETRPVSLGEEEEEGESRGLSELSPRVFA